MVALRPGEAERPGCTYMSAHSSAGPAGAPLKGFVPSPLAGRAGRRALVRLLSTAICSRGGHTSPSYRHTAANSLLSHTHGVVRSTRHRSIAFAKGKGKGAESADLGDESAGPRDEDAGDSDSDTCALVDDDGANCTLKYGNRGAYFVAWTPEVRADLASVLTAAGFSAGRRAKILKCAAQSQNTHTLLWRQPRLVEKRLAEYKKRLATVDIVNLLYLQPDLIGHQPALVQRKIEGIVQVVEEQLGVEVSLAKMGQYAPFLFWRSPASIMENLQAYLATFERDTVARAVRMRPGLLTIPAATVANKIRELEAILPGVTLCELVSRGGITLLSSSTATLRSNHAELRAALSTDFDDDAFTSLVMRNMTLLACTPTRLAAKWEHLKAILAASPHWERELLTIIGDLGTSHYVGFYLMRGAEPYARLVWLQEAGRAEEVSYDAVLRMPKKRWLSRYPDHAAWFGPDKQWHEWRAGQEAKAPTKLQSTLRKLR